MMDESTQITGVAVKYDGKVWSLPKPNRHHNVIRHIATETGTGINGPDVQGFITNNGEFLNRKAAMALAAVNGQLNRRPGGYPEPELYSEDLW
jgi:hypothetical protein